MIDIYFFQIFKNIYLKKKILKLCQYDEHVISYNYFNLPLGFLSKTKRWDLFDEKINQLQNNNSGASIDHMVGLTEKDLCKFIKYNSSYERFKKVEKVTQFLKLESRFSNLLVSAIKNGSNDLNIIRDLYQRTISNTTQDKSLLHFYFETPSPRIDVFDLVSNSFNQDDMIKIFHRQSNYKQMELAKHIYTEYLVKNQDIRYEINKLPLEIIEFLQRNNAILSVESLPPVHLDAISFILSHPYEIEKVEYQFKEAFKLGNIEMLNRMVMDAQKPMIDCLIGTNSKCPNIETFDFVVHQYGISSWAHLQPTILHDLELVKQAIFRNFTFTSVAFTSKYEVLEFLLNNNHLENVQLNDRYHTTYSKDKRIYQLLYQKYQSQFNVSPFLNPKSAEILKFCLDIGSFDHCLPDEVMPFLHFDVFYDIYQRLSTKNRSFRNYFLSSTDDVKNRLGLLWVAYQSSHSYKKIRKYGFFKGESNQTEPYLELIRQITGKQCLFDIFCYGSNANEIFDYVSYNTFFPFKSSFKHQKQLLDGYDSGDIAPILSLLYDSMHYPSYKLTEYIQSIIKNTFDQVRVTQMAYKFFTGDFESNILNQKSKLLGSLILDPSTFLNMMINDETLKISQSFLEQYISYHLKNKTIIPQSLDHFNFIELQKRLFKCE